MTPEQVRDLRDHLVAAGFSIVGLVAPQIVVTDQAKALVSAVVLAAIPQLINLIRHVTRAKVHAAAITAGAQGVVIHATPPAPAAPAPVPEPAVAVPPLQPGPQPVPPPGQVA